MGPSPMRATADGSWQWGTPCQGLEGRVELARLLLRARTLASTSGQGPPGLGWSMVGFQVHSLGLLPGEALQWGPSI